MFRRGLAKIHHRAFVRTEGPYVIGRMAIRSAPGLPGLAGIQPTGPVVLIGVARGRRPGCRQAFAQLSTILPQELENDHPP